MKNSTKLIYGIIGLSSFYIYFNRNPNREIQQGIISPTDGFIEKIENNRIDIFIGLLDVHYQRAPISGTIINIQDFPSENKNIIIIESPTITITVERRSGILARSIRTFISIGDYIEKGTIIGRILLGSHTAIYPIYNPTVEVGNRILSGQTIGN